MAAPESTRNDLYNRLVELLGADCTETLMTYRPTYEPSEVATEAGLDKLRSEVRELASDVNKRLAEMNTRIDRVLLTLATGLFVIFASVMGVLGVVIAGLT